MSDPTPTALTPLDPKLAEIARDLGMDPSVQATAEQTERMSAITLAVGCLNEAGVSYTLFASPDGPAETMKVVHGHRLSYATDVETIRRETSLARHCVLTAALKAFSMGLKGALVVVAEDGTPLCSFDAGRVVSFEKAP